MFLRRLRPFISPGAIATAAAAGSLGLWASSSGTGGAAMEEVKPPPKQGALDPDNWVSLKVAHKEQVTKNTQRLRFALPNKDETAGLPVASCLVTRAPLEKKDDGSPKMTIRPYTPATHPDTKGFLDLVVKGYEQGKMSKHINSLQVGDELEMKGPIMKLDYKPNYKKKLGMIAGGSGLTPMLQIMQKISTLPEDHTEVTLMFANVSEDDIILNSELDALAQQHDNLNVVYVVDKKKNAAFKGAEGHITADLIKQYLPPPSDDHLILVCGPPGMMKAMSGDKAPDKSQGELSGALKQLGYVSSQVFKF